MSNEASNESYRGLSDKRVELITTTLKELPYTEKELDKAILPYVAQWLYDNYVNMESTCLIISTVTNINRIQDQINKIYDGIVTLPARSKLQDFLTKDEYNKVESVIEPRKTEGTIKGEIDEETNIKVNFKTKRIYQEKIIKTKKGLDTKDTPVIEAVPYKLIVYDSPLLDQPRSFKIVWTSNVTSRNFVTSGESTGATIKEIEQYLINAGFSHSPKLVAGALSCTINTMIQKNMAIIKTDIDNPGFYYNPDNDKITPVKKIVTVPTREEMAKTAKWLNELSLYYKEQLGTLATVLKWCLVSPFSYAKKQAGDNMPWLYLKGTSKAGKTTLGRIGLFIHGEPVEGQNDIGGTSVDTVARLGAKISKSCDPLLVNEPASVFTRKSTKEMIKLCVQSTLARSKYVGSSYGGIPAFAPILFTANMYVPEDDAIINRLHVISFSYSQRKSEFEKKEFEKKFHVKASHISPLQDLKFLGQFAASEIVGEPGLLLDDWKDLADRIVTSFYTEMGTDVPDWLMLWEESESIGDLDDTQREDIRNFFVNEFNQARKKIATYDTYGNRTQSTLDIEEASTSDDFFDVNWSIVNNRLLTWAIPFTSRNGTKYICLTQGLRKSLGEKMDFCSDLKSIGELLGWDYKNTRFGKSKTMKVIKIKFDEFMEFLYPNISLMEDGE